MCEDEAVQHAPRPKVLIVAYLFPPIGGIGVQRPLKLVRYLREHGWEPVVLTTTDVQYSTMDESLLQQIPDGVKVIRVSDPLGRFMKRIQRRTTSSFEQPFPEGSANGQIKSSGLMSRVKKWKNQFLLPDESVIWALFTARAAVRAVKSESVDCVFTTAGPNSAHLVGWWAKLRTGVRWVADFRDPWTDNLHYARKGWMRSLERWMEERVFLLSDAITTVTQGFESLFVRKYPWVQDKLTVIRNGVDPLDFPLAAEREPMTRFTFFYAGILYPKRSPAPFLRALHRAIEEGVISRTEVCVEFAGVFDYPGQSANHELVKQLKLSDVVQVRGYLAHDEALKRMSQVDALLLIGENSEQASLYIPGKLYEYLFARRPIFALLPQGEASGLIQRARSGIAIEPDSDDKVYHALVTFLQMYREPGAFTPVDTEIQLYTRQGQAAQFADVLSQVQLNN